jgi:antitoxin YefM
VWPLSRPDVGDHALAVDVFHAQFSALITLSRRCSMLSLFGLAGQYNGVQESCTIKDEVLVPTDTTYTHLRANLAGILDEVIDQQEVVIVRRKGARDVALIPASELAGIIETAHLLRSPRNARRLLSALRRAETGKAQATHVRDLRREILGGP